jgi:hypothetical protein
MLVMRSCSVPPSGCPNQFASRPPSTTMHICILSVAILVASCLAQNLSTVLLSYPHLSNFTTILNKYPFVEGNISVAGGATLFVPFNGARGLKYLLQLVNSNTTTTPGLFDQSLLYHAIRGVMPVAAIPNNTFAQTFVEEKLAPNFSLVTGGQRLHMMKDGNHVSLLSAFKNKVNVTYTVSFNSFTFQTLGFDSSNRISSSMAASSTL